LQHDQRRLLALRAEAAQVAGANRGAEAVPVERRDVERPPVGLGPRLDAGCGEVGGLVAGAAYRCSCEVWLPASFEGGKIALACGGFNSMSTVPADPAKKARWLTITIHGVASGLRDEGLLESALDRLKNRWFYE